MKTLHPSPLLKLALWTDAAVSGAVALLQLAAAPALADLLALPRALLVESGVFLVAYTLLLVLLARSTRIPSLLLALIVAGNVGWALGCVGLPLAGLVAPNAPGLGYLALQAGAVLVFAAWEALGWHRSRPAAGMPMAAAH